MFWIFICAIAAILVLLLGRILYVVSKKNEEIEEKKIQRIKTLIVLGSGGHTTEMMQIVENLDFQRYTPRIYLHATTDKISADKVLELEKANRDFEIIAISRSREVGQSYLSSVRTTILSLGDSAKILWRSKPDLILCNGPGTCVPICIAMFLMKIVFVYKTRIIFVESFCRVKTFSLSGIILYYTADHIIVQWPRLFNSAKKHVKMCDLAPITGAQIPWDIISENLRKNIPIEMKINLTLMCDKLRSALESKQYIFFLLEFFIEVAQEPKSNLPPNKTLTIPQSRIHDSLMKLEACLDQNWEALNTGYWKDVPITYRYSYTLCSIMKCIFMEIQYSSSEKSEDNKKEEVIDIIKQIDKAILLGAPLPDAPYLTTEIASRLNIYLAQFSTENQSNDEIFIDDNAICEQLLPGFIWIKRVEIPSMQTFYREIFKPKNPAVLEKCLTHWRALKSWKNVNYLMKIAGNRTVPIEIGSRYTEEDWSQSLITFAEFLQSHLSGKSNKIGYLAQHQLFEQIPEMRKDFAIPDYCNFSDNEQVTAPDINAWFGPRGTVSPLHFDPKNNLLSQVFGYKRVILYRPEESSKLYSYETRLLSNTAQVDPLNPDFEKWPKFKETNGFMCYLKPGDMLYIPPGWWHHVESLTPSFSISFWWC